MNTLIAVFALIAMGTRAGWPLPVLLALLLLAHLALLMCGQAQCSPRQLLSGALLSGMIAMAGVPVAEDDFYRYQWDGWRTLHHGTPYGAAPAEFFGDEQLPPSAQAALDGVNYPETPTIYGPALQALFAMAWLLGENTLWPLRLLMLTLHLGALHVAMRFAPRRALVWVALNPTLFFFGFVNLHPDILLGWLLFFACVAARQQRIAMSGALLGVAVATKVSGLLLAPMLLAVRGIPAALRHGAPAMLLTLAFCYAPFMSFGDGPGLLAFGSAWTFNPAGFALLELAFGSAHARLMVAGLLLVLAAVWLRTRREHLAGHAVTLLLALLLLSPVVNAWYVLWLLPLAALTRALTPFALSAALSMSLLTRGELGLPGDPFSVLPWAATVQWGITGMALIMDMRRWRKPS